MFKMLRSYIPEMVAGVVIAIAIGWFTLSDSFAFILGLLVSLVVNRQFPSWAQSLKIHSETMNRFKNSSLEFDIATVGLSAISMMIPKVGIYYLGTTPAVVGIGSGVGVLFWLIGIAYMKRND